MKSKLFNILYSIFNFIPTIINILLVVGMIIGVYRDDTFILFQYIVMYLLYNIYLIVRNLKNKGE